MSKLISKEDYEQAEQKELDVLQQRVGTDKAGLIMQLTAAAFSACIKKRLFGDKKEDK